MFQHYKNRRNVFIIYLISSKHLINNYSQFEKIGDNSDNNIS